MEGYIRNASVTWRHALKRSISPGEKVTLDDLYAQYGVKHGIEKGKQFVDWLRQVKLRDSDIWEIRYKESASKAVSKKAVPDEAVDKKVVKKGSKKFTDVSQTVPFVTTKPSPEDLANLSVRNARDVIKKSTDQKILKYALNIASQLSNRDTLCQMLRKRIVELELTRR